VHERDLNTDFLLVLLARLVAAAPGLRVTLMSATLDAKLFAGYCSIPI
jgi:ATP-dependent RNA helicase DHX29